VMSLRLVLQGDENSVRMRDSRRLQSECAR
jgi:hypothetical protein